jgi:hypothetical protein
MPGQPFQMSGTNPAGAVTRPQPLPPTTTIQNNAQPLQSSVVNLRPAPSAILSRQFQGSKIVDLPFGETSTLQSQWDVNPDSPYFYLFAAYKYITTQVGGFYTKFDFLAGASVVSTFETFWGGEEVLDQIPGYTETTDPILIPFTSDIQFLFYSNFSAICPPVLVSILNPSECFITRWSVANVTQIRATTQIYTSALNDAQDLKAQVVHGVLQQPWS